MAANPSTFNIVKLLPEDVPGAILPKEPEDCTGVQLRRWLECYGQKKSGNKDTLVERVRGCMKLNVEIDPKIDGGGPYNTKASK